MADSTNRGLFNFLSRTAGRVPLVRHIPLRFVLMILGPAVLAIVGAYFYATGGRYIETENAYVKADKIAISPDVSGRVQAVEVHENDLVQRGQLLFALDEQPFRFALERAEAKLLREREVVRSLQSLHKQKQEQLRTSERNLAFFEEEFRKRQALLARGVVSQDRFDTAGGNVQAARGLVDDLREDLARLNAELSGLIDTDVANHPRVKEALAERDNAALEMEHTKIHAPATGIVTKNDLQPGEYVRAGTPIFSIVATEDLWIEANLKETQLTHVREGQTASIHVDAYPGEHWTATVSSIAPATGAEFSLLPPQNATGNWVKVVQRIPVRLQLDRKENGPPLRAGMSVIVDIDTLHQRELPGFVSKALALVRGE
ncbi:MAG: HlyD family secretion protein [Alphaproteobacteria bacterium]